ncbi:MAG: MotA/TolQ/ExbB proton channel family protein [Candidatus Omnitrophica bacterium]|nr:MotA/TolQ/ExbB proton channel family protein [Candidatus Omnitrophota bacterium]
MKTKLPLILLALAFSFLTIHAVAQDSGDVSGATVEQTSDASQGSAMSEETDSLLEGLLPTQEITVLELLKTTGVFFYPLAFFSIWMVYLVIANFLIVQEMRLVPRGLQRKVMDCLHNGMVRDAEELVAHRGDLLSQMLQSGLTKRGMEPSIIETAMEGSVSRDLTSLRNRIRRLADIGNLAPMVGLLGTVWGMIRVFQGVSEDTTSLVMNWSSILANGVAQAMVTTVAGLLIGIPSLFFYYYFRNKLANVVGHLESVGTEFAVLLSGRRGDQ